jgi:hypothetical protein
MVCMFMKFHWRVKASDQRAAPARADFCGIDDMNFGAPKVGPFRAGAPADC